MQENTSLGEHGNPNRTHNRFTQSHNSPTPSQKAQRGQAGEDAAGDAGDGIGREISAL